MKKKIIKTDTLFVDFLMCVFVSFSFGFIVFCSSAKWMNKIVINSLNFVRMKEKAMILVRINDNMGKKLKNKISVKQYVPTSNVYCTSMGVSVSKTVNTQNETEYRMVEWYSFFVMFVINFFCFLFSLHGTNRVIFVSVCVLLWKTKKPFDVKI